MQSDKSLQIPSVTKKNLKMINELVNHFGSQAVVIYIEYKKQVLGSYNDNTYRVYENGRSRTDFYLGLFREVEDEDVVKL